MSPQEKEMVFGLAEQLTGSCQAGRYRKPIILTKVDRRISQTGMKTLGRYLHFVGSNDVEYGQLMCALTINTTSWFREKPHFEHLKDYLEKKLSQNKQQKVSILSAASSSGQEVYSLGIFLESFRKKHPEFEYSIQGGDICPACISGSRRAVYPIGQLGQIPEEYHDQLLMGRGKAEGFFTLDKEIRKRCFFNVLDLKSDISSLKQKFDFIFCRNVLIYFSPEDGEKVVGQLVKQLNSNGVLTLGHSEAIARPLKQNLSLVWNSSYSKFKPKSRSKKILVVDDSATIRQLLEKFFKENKFEVLLAENTKRASEILSKETVDLITLDLQMPGQDGRSWLKAQRSSGMRIPVIIITDTDAKSSSDLLGALEDGAQDFIEKGWFAGKKSEVLEKCGAIIEGYQRRKSGKSAKGSLKTVNLSLMKSPEIIVMGASTGGTEALCRVLKTFNKKTPPVMVVQHIVPAYLESFAQRLSKVSGLPLGSMETGEKLKSGHLYLATSDCHIGVKRNGLELQLVCSVTPPVNRHRPSVDFLFQSAAQAQATSLAVVLTGMGKDGALGAQQLKNRGNFVLVQDEESSAVFGMPGETIRRGGASFIGPPDDIRKALDQHFQNT